MDIEDDEIICYTCGATIGMLENASVIAVACFVCGACGNVTLVILDSNYKSTDITHKERRLIEKQADAFYLATRTP